MQQHIDPTNPEQLKRGPEALILSRVFSLGNALANSEAMPETSDRLPTEAAADEPVSKEPSALDEYRAKKIELQGQSDIEIARAKTEAAFRKKAA